MRILKTEQIVAAVSETLFRNISKHGCPRRIHQDLFCKLTVKRIFGQLLLKNTCEGTYFLVKIKDITVLPKTNAKLIKE